MPSSFREPRVFISYARADGEGLARNLYEKLEAEKIPVWQDRANMEGGKDWWLQIDEALRHVDFMVLIMTPAALRSEIVRREWQLARRRGVCIYPVKGQSDLDFASLPQWMRDVHFFDIDLEWSNFISHLNSPCQAVRVPFMVEDLPGDFVPRPGKLKELIDKLLDDKRENPVPCKIALLGMGGYGKTTLARYLCHQISIQDAFDDGVLWIELGQNPGELVKKVNELIYVLDKERSNFTELNAATAYLVELLEGRDILLVIDNVWHFEHLNPFLQGGKRCARLICTRNDIILPSDVYSIEVGAMDSDEAIQLLTAGLDDRENKENDEKLRALAAKLYEWPLLLKLINANLLLKVKKIKLSLTDALNEVNEALDKYGFPIFDREALVDKTLEISFEMLKPEEQNRYRELAIFPKGVDIPLTILQRLWNVTGGLDKIKTKALCEYLYSLSLLLSLNSENHTIRLHDILSDYLQRRMGAELAVLHSQFLNIYEMKRWSELPKDEIYLWDYLAFHLIRAGRIEELVTTVKDLGYVAAKIFARNVRAAEADLVLAANLVPSDTILLLLKQSIARMDYLLNSCETLDEIKVVLHSRLAHLDRLSMLCRQFEQALSRPFVTAWHSLPDLADPALIRTLQGHLEQIRGCAVSPKGNYIVSAAEDGDLEAGILKVWDAQTGMDQLTLRGHTDGVLSCAVSPNEDRIISASRDKTLKVWDVKTGEVLLTLDEHTGGVNCCAVSPLGDYVVSASDDGTLKIWDILTGNVRITLDEHTDVVTGCAVSPLGDYIVSSSYDQSLKVWDTQTGKVIRTLSGHDSWVTGCAISPLGDYIVSSSYDGSLKVWDTKTGKVIRTLNGHTSVVTGCAVSPLGDYIVSGSYDRTIKVWDVQTGIERSTFYGHRGSVTACAVTPQGDWVVSASLDLSLKVWNIQEVIKQPKLSEYAESVRGCAVSVKGDYVFSGSEDKMLKIWNGQTGKELAALRGHKGKVNACAVSPWGDWVVSASDDESLKIWDVKSREVQLTLNGHKSAVNGCAVSPQGNWIVSASDDGSLKIWDVQFLHSAVIFGRSLGKLVHIAEMFIISTLRSLFGSHFKFQQRNVGYLNLEGHTSAVNGCAVSPQGNWIVSASADGSLKIWDVKTAQELSTLSGHSLWVSGCAVSPDGDWIVSASRDGKLKMWNSHTGEVLLTLDGHTGAVNGCVVSPQGDYILSVSGDRTLRIWETYTGMCLATLHVDGDLWGCAFYPDGEHIVAGGERGLYFLRLVR